MMPSRLPRDSAEDGEVGCVYGRFPGMQLGFATRLPCLPRCCSEGLVVHRRQWGIAHEPHDSHPLDIA